MSAVTNEVDVHVGSRMRQRRETLGISQGRLGRRFGLTFAQIQKYEKGSNRIGAGRLFQIAEFLGVTPGWFFEGVKRTADTAAAHAPSETGGAASPEETRAISEAFSSIGDPDIRASVLAFVRSLTAQRPGEEEGHAALQAAAREIT